MAHVVPVGAFASHHTVSFSARLNTRWHERALQIFMVIVLFHWVEHIVQAYQVWVLHWPLHRVHADGDRDVLPHVPASDRGAEHRVHVRETSGPADPGRRLTTRMKV